jgi:RHS repeat-associated protein
VHERWEDHHQVRSARQTHCKQCEPLGTTNYLYDGENTVEEVDQSGNILAKYAEGEELDQEVAEFRSGTISYYDADATGSITSLSSSTGAVTNSYIYDSYGKRAASTGNLANPFQYAGRELDSETGLLFNRARYYDPNAGRFVTEDTAAFGGSGTNFYRYVRNNPVNLVDPLGLTDCVVTPLGPVCNDWKPGLNWMQPQDPGPPMVPPELWSFDDKPCGCEEIAKIEEEANHERWKAVRNMMGISSSVMGAEHWGPKWFGRLVAPVVETLDWAHFEYEIIYKINREENEKIEKVRKSCGQMGPEVVI